MNANAKTMNRIAPHTVAEGILRSSGDVQIEGDMDGQLQSEGTIRIANSGKMTGEVNTQNAHIEGNLEGSIEAEGKIEASDSSQIEGEVAAARLVVHPGASLKGTFFISPKWREEQQQYKANQPDQDASAAKKSAETDTRRNVTIETEFPDARKVRVFGSFNNWDRTKSMKLHRTEGGKWKVDLKLEPGTYEYLFLVNGQEELDPTNPEKATNDVGTENSVLHVE